MNPQDRSFFRLQWAALLLIATGLLASRSIAQAPPHLLLSPADFTRLNELARTQPWAAKQRAAILKEADEFPDSYEKRFGLTSLELPPEGGQWAHDYVCPDTGTELKFHPPDEHVCTDTGRVMKGAPYDQIVYQDRAFALDEGALAAALAYRLTGDHAYAVKGAQILKLYADRYLTYPLHGIMGREQSPGFTLFGGRVFAQTLDEAEFLINICWTYDLLRDTDVFTPQERTHIERDLIYAAAMICDRSKGPTDNISSWTNGAVAAAGYVLDDKMLVDQAIDGPWGFRFQMKNYVQDGFWIEGALGYQYYALEPLEYTAMMAKRAGVDLWKQEPNLGALFESPLGLILPDGTTPGFNDARAERHVLDERAHLYEAAYSALGNKDFAAINFNAGRANRDAFLFGVASIDAGSLPKPKSAVFPDAGYATLRAPVGDLTEIMKFGPFGGSHGHFDKLTEIIFAKGVTMSVDPGTQRYGMPSHYTWDKVTVAHNTVSVDEAVQKPATGKLVAWQAEPEFAAVTADAGPVYDGVDLQRTSVLTSDYVLEITTAKSTDGKEHDFDWNYHNYGVQHADGTFAAYSGFPQKDGYQHLEQNQTAAISGDLHTEFVMDKDHEMNVWVLGGGVQSQVFTGLGLGPDLPVKIPYVIVRRHGVEARFVAVLEPGPAAAGIVSVTSAGGKIRIMSAKWEDTIEPGEKIAYHRVSLP